MGSRWIGIETLACPCPREAVGHLLCEASLGIFGRRQLRVKIAGDRMKGLDASEVHGLEGPDSGPPKDPEKSKSIGDGIFEFRESRRKGGVLRVLYFYASDRRYRIVCTHGFWKKSTETPPGEKARAIRKRKEYIVATSKNEIVINDRSADA